jgi:hypothetical protein
MGQRAKSMPLLGEMLHEVVGRLKLVERVQLAVLYGAASKIHAPPGQDAARNMIYVNRVLLIL